MRWSDIPWSPPNRMLRQFAGLWLAVFGGMAAWHGIVRDRPARGAVLALLAVGVGGLGLWRPRVLRPLFVGWMVLAFPIGWTVSQVILLVMYFGLFMPIGLVFRLIGRDPLHRARRAGVESYWTTKPVPVDVRSYFKQF